MIRQSQSFVAAVCLVNLLLLRPSNLAAAALLPPASSGAFGTRSAAKRGKRRRSSMPTTLGLSDTSEREAIDEEDCEAGRRSAAARTGGGAGLPSRFNPFDYQPRSTLHQGRGITSTTTIQKTSSYPSFDPTKGLSLRRMRMQDITNQLLQAAEAEEAARTATTAALAAATNDTSSLAMSRILDDNREFLLEPLETESFGDGGGGDPDSIYLGVATRRGRYQAYRTNIDERIRQAKNPAARRVLEVLRDYVLAHEA